MTTSASCMRCQCRPETGAWADVFGYCQDRCRTSSKSTVHENAYLSASHHCYSKSGEAISHSTYKLWDGSVSMKLQKHATSNLAGPATAQHCMRAILCRKTNDTCTTYT